MSNLQLIQFIQRYRREFALDPASTVICDLALELVQMRVNITNEVRQGHHDAGELASRIAKMLQLEVPTVMLYLEEK
jgi:hypothetical protein